MKSSSTVTGSKSISRGKKRVFTRNGLDWTKRFSVIAGALNIPGQAILDGEVVVIHEGRTNFSELQAELAAGKQDRLVYYAFDLLWRDRDLRKLPQMERKRMLSDLLGENDIGHPAIYSEHLTGDGQEMFEHATKLNFEGIVSKNAQAPYRSDRNEGWFKVKTVRQGKFPVIGFVKDPSGVAALYLGKREGKDLVYMGKVGTGWSRTVSSQIRKQLDTVVSPKSKLTSRSGNRRPRGSSRPSSRTWSIATSLPKVCCGKARSRASSGNRFVGLPRRGRVVERDHPAFEPSPVGRFRFEGTTVLTLQFVPEFGDVHVLLQGHHVGQRLRGSHYLHGSVPGHPNHRAQQGAPRGVRGSIEFRFVQIAGASACVPRKLEGEPADDDDRRSHAARS
jgi:bifunctional non-homologous end joining protein LigD